MDSRERHELKENELAEIVTNFRHWWSQRGRQWWAKHGNSLLLSVIIVLVTVGGYRWYRFNNLQKLNDAWSQLALTASPQGYRKIAETFDQPAVRALAYLRGADALLTESFTPSANDANSPQDAASSAQDKLQDAAAMYQLVLDISAQPAFTINALMGLAAVAEAQGDWPQANDFYQQAIDLGAEQFPAIAQQATLRQGMLADLQTPITFGPEPKPVAETSSDATDQPAPADTPTTDQPTPSPVGE